MTSYVSEAIPSDPGTLKQQKIDRWQALIAGADVAPGTFIDVLFDVLSSDDAQLAQLATDVQALIFRYSGEKIDRTPQRLAVQATGTTTWTRVGTSDYPLSNTLTVPAGTGFSLLAGDGTRVAFQTVSDFTFAASSATATGVAVVAVSGGEDANGLTASPQLDQAYAWFSAITVTAAPAGGADAEDDDDYLDRLADTRPLRATTLVRPEDFERYARNQTGVDMALAINRYDPAAPAGTGLGAGQPGHVTVALRSSTGGSVGSTVKATVLAGMQAAALTDLTVHAIDPTANTITVAFTGISATGYDPADVQARAIQAVLDFLNPALWGLPSTGDQKVWVDVPVVRWQDVSTVLNNVAGFDHHTSLTVNGGTSDVTLTGPAALPAAAPPTSVTGTVTS